MSHHNDWTCPDCGNNVFGSKRECKCGKWRPKDNSASNNSSSVQKKKGDWNCTSCSDLNFASRDKCRKCGAAKSSAISSTSTNNTSSGTSCNSSGVVLKAVPKPGDWLCIPCNENNFGSRKACFKCGADRKGEGLCAVCIDKVADICLKNCGHIMMCQSCASKCRECPACRVSYGPADCIKSFKIV